MEKLYPLLPQWVVVTATFVEVAAGLAMIASTVANLAEWVSWVKSGRTKMVVFFDPPASPHVQDRKSGGQNNSTSCGLGLDACSDNRPGESSGYRRRAKESPRRSPPSLGPSVSRFALED